MAGNVGVMVESRGIGRISGDGEKGRICGVDGFGRLVGFGGIEGAYGFH